MSNLSPTAFEQHTNLPLTIIEEASIVLSTNTKNNLHSNRVKYVQKLVTFNNDSVIVPNKFITSTKSSFEPLIMHNVIGLKSPKLTAGLKWQDEYYFDFVKKNVFIIEKKTQRDRGSVDEKIQTAGFKQYVLRQKFNRD
jgi:hypothetical protein